jgi:outer membrane protein TolC
MDEPDPDADVAAAPDLVLRRPDIRALAAQVEATKLAIGLIQVQSAPAVDLAVGYALQTPSAFVAGSSWSAGLTLTIPLGARPRVAAEAREIAARASAARVALAELEQGSRLELQQSLQSMRAARRRRASADRAVAAAAEALRIAELQFQRGRATSLELNAAGAALQRHRLDSLRALFDWHIAAADLERAMGVPVQEPEERR